ncbi:MAG: hypothetical protein POELPBGB_00754 [Bacteroidia bacterium]|nr:hypothetical protein [Bacteroidia bacterium]
MKKILQLATAFSFILLCVNANAQSNFSSAENLDLAIAQKLNSKNIEGVQLGTLMCEDENGNMVICSGNEFEKILGFATNVPYVTVNKPQNANDKKDEFTAFASGEIAKGDYLTAGKNGTVIRCEKSEFPYAVALESANSGGQKIRVKILGNRR